MISRIYKITNDINNKVYVGKTTTSLEDRFKNHIDDSKRERMEKRPLYNAMNKYGVEHFSISLIEECDSSILNEREQYWIGYYKGYEEGYNATLGGDGAILYDYSVIEQMLKEGKTTFEICEKIGCCKDVVYKVAKQCSIKLENTGSLYKEMKDNKIKVNQYDLQGNFIQSFDSYADAARWLLENGKISKLGGGVRSHIGEVCNGTRKSAYKYKWTKAE